MLTVDEYRDIRIARRDGLSIRAIARKLRHSRRKVREALANPEPKPYTRSKAVPRPKLGDCVAVIDQILADDEQAPRKQRHTAAQVFRRLLDENKYQGKYDAVRRYIAKARKRSRPTFVPLQHAPGRRLEADFGHIYVDYPVDCGGRRQVPVLNLTWSYSYATFMMKLPTERLESVLLGIVTGLEFFGCVPRELWWDNPTTLATAILKGRERQVQARYAALASHYCFDPKFCMPASGWEKPDAENRVYDLQRRFATPVPKVKDDAELNTHLLRCCQAEMSRTVAGQTRSIGALFAQDKAAAAPLPIHRFDPCVFASAKVDHYQTVRYDKARYSVPRNCPKHASCGDVVTIKAYANHLEIIDAGQIVARHARRYDAGQQLDPMHYLVTLARRPMAFDHAEVYRNWQLPAAFPELRQKLEARHGSNAGLRHFIQVLQLLAEHPLTRIEQAVHTALAGAPALLDGGLIRQQAQQLAQQDAGTCTDGDGALPGHVPPVTVPQPDLNRFNQLLATPPAPVPLQPSSGEPHHA